MEQASGPRTIGELAALLGVSSMTIHRAIADKPDIAPETRRRILAEIERLGWRPNLAARGLRQGKTFSLGILVSNVAASFLPRILQGVNQTAEESGYHTFVCVHEHDPARAEAHLRTLHSKGVDSIIHYPTECGGEAAVLRQVARSTPVVTIMRVPPEFDGPAVVIDDHRGGRIAAEHLLQLGHTRFGFMGYAHNEFSELRRRGFGETLRAAGLSLPAAWTRDESAPEDSSGLRAARDLLGLPDRPTAVFCASDRLAARIVQAAFELGIRIPEQLSVVGYNNDPWGALLPVPLTTIGQPRAELGRRAAELALAASSRPVNGHATNGTNGYASGGMNGHGQVAKPARIVLAPWLEQRASTAPVLSTASKLPNHEARPPQ